MLLSGVFLADFVPINWSFIVEFCNLYVKWQKRRERFDLIHLSLELICSVVILLQISVFIFNKYYTDSFYFLFHKMFCSLFNADLHIYSPDCSETGY